MTLTPEQKQAVAGWIAAGDNLSVVQKKLSEQFKISMTYMDVRFLVDDLGLELKNAAPKADASDLTKAASAGAGAPPPPRSPADKKGFLDKMKEKVGLGAADDEDELPSDEMDDTLPGEAAPGAPGGVTVDLDRIVRPGAVVSGSVTFSDGVTAKWALDQYGRLMLDSSPKGYQPTQADVQAFQLQLQKQLQRHGY
ncbi:MAG TPA: hypothetical protein VHD61_03645 [Lacunisphaera sp.]|nr:hypothetical protein [Lacunisphaera sp.]